MRAACAPATSTWFACRDRGMGLPGVEVSPSSFGLATLVGHLEAGQIAFRTKGGRDRLEFEIESWDRSIIASGPVTLSSRVCGSEPCVAPKLRSSPRSKRRTPGGGRARRGALGLRLLRPGTRRGTPAAVVSARGPDPELRPRGPRPRSCGSSTAQSSGPSQTSLAGSRVAARAECSRARCSPCSTSPTAPYDAI